ncbi:MAG: hypothetical protein IKB73_00300 [Ruminococcus sp.]|nr:hypothetical protein [Ruminococcus sp.]
MKHKGRRFSNNESAKNESNIIKADFTSGEKSDAKAQNIDSEHGPQSEDSDEFKPMTKRQKRKLIKKSRKLRKKEAEKHSKLEADAKLKESDDAVSENSDDKNFVSDTNENIPFSQWIKNTFNLLKSNKKYLFLSAVILLVLLVCVFCYANRDRLSFTNIKNWVQYGVFHTNDEDTFPISTQGDVITNGNFTRIDSNLVYISDTQFVTANNYGKTIYNSKQNYINPALVKASDCDLSLSYNIGSTDFFINTIDTNVYTGMAEDNIFVADICKNGTYALVTEKDGYLSKLYVYSNENKQIFAYSFADYYITSVALNDDGTKATLTGISAHEATPISAVYLLDFTKEEPLVFEEFSDNVLYHCDYLNNNYICIIGENSSYVLNSRTKSFSTTNYDGKTLTAFDVNTDTNTFTLSLSRSGDGRMCDLLSFSTSGVLKNSVSTELSVTAMSTYKNRIAVLSGDTVSLYTKDGKLLSEEDAGLDPHSVVLYSSSDAYVLGVSEIRRLDL